jgi:uncharacterized protein (UPF0548 family)
VHPNRRSHPLLVLLIAAVLATPASAQGRGKDHDDRHRAGVVQQGHANKDAKHKVHTSDDAVDVARIVLREQGYDFVRVERRGTTRVVYYRRGNMGRGRGKGPLMYMVVRPARERIIIERAPRPLLAQINVRLGY